MLILKLCWIRTFPKLQDCFTVMESLNDIHISTTTSLAGVCRTWGAALAIIGLYGCALNAMATEALAFNSTIVSLRMPRGSCSRSVSFISPKFTHMANSTPANW
jgi:hypothetical protein